MARVRTPPRPVRAAPGTPKASLTTASADTFLAFDEIVGARGELVAYLEKPPAALEEVFALDVEGALVVRRSVAEGVLSKAVKAGVIRLVPVAVAAGKRPARPKPPARIADADFCRVEVRLQLAAQRALLSPSDFHWGERQAESVSRERAQVIALSGSPFDAESVPTSDAFRVHELPYDRWLQAGLFDKLAAALGGQIVVGRTRPSPPFVASRIAPSEVSDKHADRAAEIYAAALTAARSDKKEPAERAWPAHLGRDRAALLRLPRYAYLAGVAEGARDDSRRATLAEPWYALAYARDVDGVGRDDTREAAARDADAATCYARDVDRGDHATTRRGAAPREARYDAVALDASAQVTAQFTADGRGTKRVRAASEGEGFEVVVLKNPATAAYVNVLWSPASDTAWGLSLTDGDVTVELQRNAAGKKLASKLDQITCLSNGATGPWVLDRALATRMFQGVRGARLLTPRVVHADRELRSNLVYVDVDGERFLDRARAMASYADATRPWASVVRAVRDIAVLAAPPPPEGGEVARVSEFPGVLVVSAGLLQRWLAAKAPIARIAAPHGHLAPATLFASWDEGPPWPDGDDEGAHRAFLALAAGESGRRGAAVARPLFAYMVARLFDGAPRPDTRKAALLHPHTATLYARFVEQRADDETRQAAARSGPTALFYAHHVDKALREPIRAALLTAGWAEDDLEKLGATLARQPRR